MHQWIGSIHAFLKSEKIRNPRKISDYPIRFEPVLWKMQRTYIQLSLWGLGYVRRNRINNLTNHFAHACSRTLRAHLVRPRFKQIPWFLLICGNCAEFTCIGKINQQAAMVQRSRGQKCFSQINRTRTQISSGGETIVDEEVAEGRRRVVLHKIKRARRNISFTPINDLLSKLYEALKRRLVEDCLESRQENGLLFIIRNYFYTNTVL